MKKEFVPYELAVKLKILGFDEPCFVRVWWLNSLNRHTKEPYKPHITMNGHDIKFEYPIPEKHPSLGFDALELQVPTFSQAFRWLREKGFFVSFSPRDYNIYDFYIKWSMPNSSTLSESILSDTYDTYEETELACLTKLIEIVETRTK